MKISLLVGLVFSLNTLSAEQYILKTNNLFNKNTIKNIGTSRELKLSFGTYQIISTDRKLSSQEIMEINQIVGIEYIEEDYILQTQETKAKKARKDWYYDQQWGLLNTGANSRGNRGRGVAGEDINAEAAWQIEDGSKEIIIAVIDTGIDYDHPDLKDNMWINQKEKNGIDGIDDDGNGFVDDIHGYNFVDQNGSPQDGKGHGTHCAGIIGASHNNIGVKGTMKNVQLMAVRFLDDAGTGTVSDAIAAIDYSINNGAHILSNSWAGNFYSQALFDGVEASYRAKLVFVAAAGNERNDNDRWETYPANFELDNIISVGAMTGAGEKATFSNYGQRTVHIFAPGESILSTYSPKTYKWLSGTSMATPFISGLLGLALSKNTEVDYQELKNALIETSVANEQLNDYAVGGRADGLRLLTFLQN